MHDLRLCFNLQNVAKLDYSLIPAIRAACLPHVVHGVILR
jgi:hypothetical protein